MYVPPMPPETFRTMPMVPPPPPVMFPPANENPLPNPNLSPNPLPNMIVNQIDYYFRLFSLKTYIEVALTMQMMLN